ncbi:CvpA family protein [Stenotrophobium rhamnosiphilum]|uniref:Colicin V production CvpA n=1 Tax=Stenotrophobium rhamnosiphilum TaxID=2029166 RepID=A0A2T5MEX9_9GAMM|nr:CvpA family protein [Stenotrophobium rhamnosiphilum]PTU31122.1 colicin V production CvpA [Stenotrophobium rhamnosiphilum]
MIWVDWCIVAVFLISILIGLLRGFAREILNVLTWVLAFGLAWLFGDMMAGLLTGHISSPEIRAVCAYAVLFIAGLLIGAILTYLLTEWIRGSFLDGIDRTLGATIGFLRALFLTCVFLVIAGTMGAKQDRWWTQSAFIPHIEWLAEDLKLIIPERWLERIKPTPESAPTIQKH